MGDVASNEGGPRRAVVEEELSFEGMIVSLVGFQEAVKAI